MEKVKQNVTADRMDPSQERSPTDRYRVEG
jgi:hypothetical protein